MLIGVVAFLDDMPLGAELAPGELPLHVTLLPPCSTEAELGRIEAAVESALAEFGPIECAGGDDDLVGDVEVTLLEDDEARLAALHRALLLALRPLGVRVIESGFVGVGYRPHVAVQDSERIDRGERVELDAVALLTRDDGPWELVAQFPLL